MAVLSRIARVRMDDAASHTTNVREVTATAATQDSPAAASVDIVVTHTVLGLPPSAPNTITLSAYTDAGALIRSYALTTAPATTQTVTFFFTSDGTATGAPRAGTVEIAIRITRTDLTNPFDVESDGSPNTSYTGFDTHLDRGWIRGTTTATVALSNVAPGGAKLTPGAYDESLFARVTLGAVLYVARALTVGLSGATPALSGATTSSTAGPWDATLAGVVDNRFPAAVTASASSLTVPNAALTGQPATVVTTTNDTLDVDPRITFTKLLQLNDATFGTPPSSKNNIRGQRLSADLGFLAARATNARGAGINGLAWTEKLWDDDNLISSEAAPAKTRPTTSTTKGGEAGWSDAFLVWDNQLPGGGWTQKQIITTADATGLEVANTRALTLLAINPNLIPVIGGGSLGNEADSHWSPGLPFYMHMSLHDHTLHSYAVVDASPAPGVHVYRHNSDTRKDQALEADGITWTNVLDSDAPRHALTAEAADPNVYTKTFTAEQTAGWGYHDIHLIGHINNNSTPYAGDTVIQALASSNDHGGFALDPVAFALGGLVSFR